MEVALQLLINSIVVGSAYALAAAGFTLIFGVLKLAHFAHGDVAMVGAYLALATLAATGASGVAGLALAALVAVAGCGVLGVLIERLLYRPLRSASALQLLIGALAASRLLQSAVQLTAGDEIRAFRLPDWPPVQLAGASITPVQLAILLLSLACFGGLHLLVHRTLLGAQVRAVADDPVLARTQGVPAERVTVVVFALGSALAGLAGLMLGLELHVHPAMGFALVLKTFAAVVLGGIGSLSGALLGAFAIGLLENVGGWFAGGLWKESMAYLALLAILLLRPAGMFNPGGEEEAKL